MFAVKFDSDRNADQIVFTSRFQISETFIFMLFKIFNYKLIKHILGPIIPVLIASLFKIRPLNWMCKCAFIQRFSLLPTVGQSKVECSSLESFVRLVHFLRPRLRHCKYHVRYLSHLALLVYGWHHFGAKTSWSTWTAPPLLLLDPIFLIQIDYHSVLYIMCVCVCQLDEIQYLENRSRLCQHVFYYIRSCA
jgi:hypothetical protein